MEPSTAPLEQSLGHPRKMQQEDNRSEVEGRWQRGSKRWVLTLMSKERGRKDGFDRRGAGSGRAQS